MSRGGDINVKNRRDERALNFAGTGAIVDVLIALGSDPKSSDWRSALGSAASRGNTEVLRALLDHGADANQRDTLCDKTPLHFACSSSDLKFEAIQMLLAAGADPQCTDRSMETPLHCLMSNASNEETEGEELRRRIALALLDAGANVNAADTRKNTPLMSLVRASRRSPLESIFELFIANGADIGAVNQWGYTPLTLSVSVTGNIFQMLLSHGAGSLPGAKVLIEYCGLWVVRSVVSPDGKRADLHELLGADRQADEMRNRLPPEMDWYIDKKWLLHVDELSAGFVDGTETDRQVAGYVQQLDAKLDHLNCQVVAGTNSVHAHLDDVKLALLTQGAADGNRRDFPALWTLEYQQDGPMLTSTFVLRIRSHLTGKCYHEPIELTVPSQFFGKYGVAIKYGLSLFASVTPSMLGKGVVEAFVNGCNSQLDRAVALHSLVEGLDLGTYGSMTMEKNRSLSPDETVMLLRDLLTVCDASFEPMRMSKLAKLECGIVWATGEHIWAHRGEIAAQHPEIRLRHDYVGGHTPGRSVDEPAMSSPIGSDILQSLPNLRVDVKSGVEPAPVEVRLCILGVDNLRRTRLIGTQSPYSKWALLDPSGQEVASGRTTKHVNGGCNPVWSGQPFLVPVPKSVTTLKGCTILFTVKTRAIIGPIKGVDLIVMPTVDPFQKVSNLLPYSQEHDRRGVDDHSKLPTKRRRKSRIASASCAVDQQGQASRGFAFPTFALNASVHYCTTILKLRLATLMKLAKIRTSF